MVNSLSQDSQEPGVSQETRVTGPRGPNRGSLASRTLRLRGDCYVLEPQCEASNVGSQSAPVIDQQGTGPPEADHPRSLGGSPIRDLRDRLGREPIGPKAILSPAREDGRPGPLRPDMLRPAR